jgi:hypothetical protein
VVILGVDPGNVTGCALFDVESRALVTSETPASAVRAVLLNMLDGRKPSHILCERYARAASAGPRPVTSQPAAREVTGVVQSLGRELGTRVVLQSPGSAKKCAPNALLRALGWHRVTPDGHADDAARQVLLGLARFYPTVFHELTGI